MDDSNVTLVRLIQQNDSAAFAKLLGQHYAAVFDRCMRMLGHRQDAEDATQETFSRAVRYINRWDPRRPLEPWLITIAGNRCRTQLAKRQPVVSLSDTESEAIEATSQIAVQHQQQQRDANSLHEEVQRAVAKLPAKHRCAFKLFHEDGLDYQQIAAKLNCPIGTAKTWVHRARTNLMQQLSERNVVSSNQSPASKRESKKTATPAARPEMTP